MRRMNKYHVKECQILLGAEGAVPYKILSLDKNFESNNHLDIYCLLHAECHL